jgi:hypothetical protein
LERRIRFPSNPIEAILRFPPARPCPNQDASNADWYDPPQAFWLTSFHVGFVNVDGNPACRGLFLNWLAALKEHDVLRCEFDNREKRRRIYRTFESPSVGHIEVIGAFVRSLAEEPRGGSGPER